MFALLCRVYAPVTFSFSLHGWFLVFYFQKAYMCHGSWMPNIVHYAISFEYCTEHPQRENFVGTIQNLNSCYSLYTSVWVAFGCFLKAFFCSSRRQSCVLNSSYAQYWNKILINNNRKRNNGNGPKENGVIGAYANSKAPDQPVTSHNPIELRKHAYSNILRILSPKNKNFQMKKFVTFHISAQNINCGYLWEPSRRGGSNAYPHLCFWAETRKLTYTPAVLLYKSGV